MAEVVVKEPRLLVDFENVQKIDLSTLPVLTKTLLSAAGGNQHQVRRSRKRFGHSFSGFVL